jgi:RNA polymerase sigma-70 factor (sigma-E family)
MNLCAEGPRSTEPSFESFVAGSSTRLIRAAYLLCGDHQIAEDLWQMTMMRTARRWSAARSAPEAYARAVLVNLARDRARRGRRRVDEVPGEVDDFSRFEGRLGADHTDQVAERDLILTALSALPQRQREVIVLRFYADLSVAETAAAIGASEGTVMSHTSRALSRLREVLSEPGADHVMGEVQHDHR